MNDPQETISAFLDDEPFDSEALVDALSAPAGRELLVELVALRHLVRGDAGESLTSSHRRSTRSAFLALAAAAAVVLALLSGYVAGQRRSGAERAAAPPATRIVPASAAWQEVPRGSMP